MLLCLQTKIELLKKFGFLAEQKMEVFEFLAKKVETQNFKAGDSIFSLGDQGGAVYVVVKGCIQIHDQDHVFIELPEGRSFGEYALIESEERTASAKAKKDSVLLKCTQEN